MLAVPVVRPVLVRFAEAEGGVEHNVCARLAIRGGILLDHRAAGVFALIARSCGGALRVPHVLVDRAERAVDAVVRAARAVARIECDRRARAAGHHLRLLALVRARHLCRALRKDDVDVVHTVRVVRLGVRVAVAEVRHERDASAPVAERAGRRLGEKGKHHLVEEEGEVGGERLICTHGGGGGERRAEASGGGVSRSMGVHAEGQRVVCGGDSGRGRETRPRPRPSPRSALRGRGGGGGVLWREGAPREVRRRALRLHHGDWLQRTPPARALRPASRADCRGRGGGVVLRRGRHVDTPRSDESGGAHAGVARDRKSAAWYVDAALRSPPARLRRTPARPLFAVWGRSTCEERLLRRTHLSCVMTTRRGHGIDRPVTLCCVTFFTFFFLLYLIPRGLASQIDSQSSPSSSARGEKKM